MDIEQVKELFRETLKEKNEMPDLTSYISFLENSLIESLYEIKALQEKVELYQVVKECKNEECECGC